MVDLPGFPRERATVTADKSGLSRSGSAPFPHPDARDTRLSPVDEWSDLVDNFKRRTKM
jgi:hypothetical protein